MRCREFLRAYSDYRDGLIADVGVVVRVHEHLAACGRCRHYDRIITSGVRTLRNTGVDPDPDAAARLQALVTPTALTPPIPTHSGVFSAAIVVAAFGLIAWDAVRDTSPSAQPPVPTPTATAVPVVVANPGVPFVRFADFAAPDEAPTRLPDLTPVASSLTLYPDTPDR